QRVIEGQAHVVAVHVLLQTAVAEVGEQALAREVPGAAGGNAEVDDLPHRGPGRGGLRLDEADHALRVVLGDEQDAARVIERNQRGQGLAERVPEAQQGCLWDRAVRVQAGHAEVGVERVAIELFHSSQVAEGRRADVHAALSRTASTCSRKSRWRRSSPVISGWKVSPMWAPWRTATGSPSRVPRTSTPSPIDSMRGARMNTPRKGRSPSSETVMSASKESTWLPQPLRRTAMSRVPVASWSGRPSAMVRLSRMRPAQVLSVGIPSARRLRRASSSAKARGGVPI